MPTAKEVREYAERNFTSMMQAKVALLNETEPVLQFCDHNGVWRDVQTVIEVRDESRSQA
jgi:hypothetical protein